jgi:hypothetical protein
MTDPDSVKLMSHTWEQKENMHYAFVPKITTHYDPIVYKNNLYQHRCSVCGFTAYGTARNPTVLENLHKELLSCDDNDSKGNYRMTPPFDTHHWENHPRWANRFVCSICGFLASGYKIQLIKTQKIGHTLLPKKKIVN